MVELALNWYANFMATEKDIDVWIRWQERETKGRKIVKGNEPKSTENIYKIEKRMFFRLVEIYNGFQSFAIIFLN